MGLIVEIVRNYCDATKYSLNRQDAITALLAVREANRNKDGTFDNTFTLAERDKFKEICKSNPAKRFVLQLLTKVEGSGCNKTTSFIETPIASSTEELTRFMSREKFGDEFLAESSRTELGECKATEPTIDREIDLLEERNRWDDFDGTGLGGA